MLMPQKQTVVLWKERVWNLLWTNSPDTFTWSSASCVIPFSDTVSVSYFILDSSQTLPQVLPWLPVIPQARRVLALLDPPEGRGRKGWICVERRHIHAKIVCNERSDKDEHVKIYIKSFFELYFTSYQRNVFYELLSWVFLSYLN